LATGTNKIAAISSPPQQPTITFTKDVEANDTLPFLDVLVMKKGPKLAMKVYRKPTHAGRYLPFKSNHPHHVKEESFIA
jgi:hypothetical protein